VEVEWDLTDLKGTRIDNITTKSYSAIYALPYSKLKQATAGSVKMFQLEIDFGSGTLIVYVECGTGDPNNEGGNNPPNSPNPDKPKDNSLESPPVEEPLAIQYEGINYK